MVSLFKQILQRADQINNSNVVIKKISSEQLEYHVKNLKDFEDTLKKISNLIESIKGNKIEKIKAKEFIALLHPQLMHLHWYIDDLDELLIDLLKKIPDEGNEL